MNEIKDKSYDEERALYNLKDTTLYNCTFKGKKDGESVLKETRNIIVDNCSFALRYPLWHAQEFSLINSTMDENTRAPIWYSKDGLIKGSTINGIKCLRECKDINIEDSTITSPEFGWMCDNVRIHNTKVTSEYMMLHTNNIFITDLIFTGKYSFQYDENLEIDKSNLDTKDAFWHSKNVTIKNSILKGEYLAWFSENLTLINCTITSHQPFCYAKKLKLINCKMIDCDLAFEYSDVNATILGNIKSVKNILKGVVICDSCDEIINDHPVKKCTGKVKIRGKQS